MRQKRPIDAVAVALATALSSSACICSGSEQASRGAPTSDEPPRFVAGPAPEIGETVVFEGSCDPSGAVPLDRRTFAVADDEDNILRIYDADKGGPPIRSIDLSPELELEARDPESDLEGATRLGDLAFWITSHARRKSGRVDQARELFFASRLPLSGTTIEIVGEPYRDLQSAFNAAPQLARFGLAAAARLPPDQIGGLNIEGLTATPAGALLVGFRNPVPDGLALIVPIENPTDIPWGAHPKIGEPIRLDLMGLGARGLSWWRGQYLIVAGPIAFGPTAVFSWPGPGHRPRLILDDLAGLNPEAFFTPEDRDTVLLLSDDGMVEIDGRPCKRLKDPARKQFRGLHIKPY